MLRTVTARPERAVAAAPFGAARSASEQAAIREARRFAKPPHRFAKWMGRMHALADYLDARGVSVPPDLMTTYRPSPEEVIGGTRLQKKYFFRPLNTLRELARLTTFYPEILDSSARLTFWDTSAGPCGTFEVARSLGHDAIASDYCPDDGLWLGNCYRTIRADIGAEPHHFDGRVLPYAAPREGIDHVLCFQAIDVYAHPDGWIERVEALLDIARASVALIFNPPAAAYGAAEEEARETPAWERALARFEGTHRVERHICPDTGLPAAVIRHRTGLALV